MSVNFEDALKAKKLRDFFYEHKRIFILVDAAADDVQLPEHLKHEHALPLVLNARMPQPIHIKDSFLESNFSFSGVSQHCVIPMRRIWAAYLPDRDLSSGMVWETDMPEQLQQQLLLQGMIKDEDKEGAQATVGASKAPEQEFVETDELKSERKVRHLRVVK